MSRSRRGFLSSSAAPPTPVRSGGPQRFHLDKRAATIAAVIAAEGGQADDLLTTRELAFWLGVSPVWLELGRAKNYGPPFIRLAPQVLRYRRAEVLIWLKEREHFSNAASPRRDNVEA